MLLSSRALNAFVIRALNAFVIPNEVRDLGFCTSQQRPGFLASLGMRK